MRPWGEFEICQWQYLYPCEQDTYVFEFEVPGRRLRAGPCGRQYELCITLSSKDSSRAERAPARICSYKALVSVEGSVPSSRTSSSLHDLKTRRASDGFPVAEYDRILRRALSSFQVSRASTRLQTAMAAAWSPRSAYRSARRLPSST